MLCLLVVLLLVGCGKPRTRDDIFQERVNLPKLYLTGDTSKEVVDSGSKGIFVDPESGEICFEAKECHNPDCPGLSGGKKYLFIDADPTVVITPDGKIGADPSKMDPNAIGGCPKCLEKRTPASETPEQKQQYIKWSQPHVLPETAKRLEELDAELKTLE